MVYQKRTKICLRMNAGKLQICAVFAGAVGPGSSARAIALFTVPVVQSDLHNPQFFSQFPASVGPEFHTCHIVGEDKEVASLNAGLFQPGQTGVHQSSPDTPPTISFGQGQMMQITAATLMAA
jgi:hypothetical protein